MITIFTTIYTLCFGGTLDSNFRLPSRTHRILRPKKSPRLRTQASWVFISANKWVYSVAFFIQRFIDCINFYTFLSKMCQKRKIPEQRRAKILCEWPGRVVLLRWHSLRCGVPNWTCFSISTKSDGWFEYFNLEKSYRKRLKVWAWTDLNLYFWMYYIIYPDRSLKTLIKVFYRVKSAPNLSVILYKARFPIRNARNK